MTAQTRQSNITISIMATIVINKDLCKGCQYCIKACPNNLILLSNKINSNGYIYAKYTESGCTGCGFCFYSCPEVDVIEVNP